MYSICFEAKRAFMYISMFAFKAYDQFTNSLSIEEFMINEINLGTNIQFYTKC